MEMQALNAQSSNQLSRRALRFRHINSFAEVCPSTNHRQSQRLVTPRSESDTLTLPVLPAGFRKILNVLLNAAAQLVGDVQYA